MRRRMALLYKYFQLKNLPMPYFRTIIAFSALLTFHLFLIYVIFPVPGYFTPFGLSKVPIINYAIGVLWFGILYLVFSIFFKTKDLEFYSFTEDEIKKGALKLLLYFILLFILIFSFSVLKVRRLW